MNAIDFLDAAAAHMGQRAQTYDSPTGERSMGAAIDAFNSITGQSLSESDGWLLMVCLKLVRMHQRAGFHQDSAEDAVAYAALLGEARSKINQ